MRPVEEKNVDIVSKADAFLPQATTLAPIARAVVTAEPPNLPVAGATMTVSPGRMLISERPPKGTRKPAPREYETGDFGKRTYRVEHRDRQLCSQISREGGLR
jgi:hypothetical protein